MEPVPNQPLPWKGVGLVLIPCLVFFAGQIGQLAGQDWFFLLVYRASYFLILPVLLIWLLTRKFPVWGLIPLGMFYRTILDLSDRLEYLLGKIGFFFADRLGTKFTPGFIVFLENHIPEIQILLTAIILGTVIFLIIRIARRGGFARSSWIWLGVFLFLTAIEMLSNLISTVGWLTQTSAENTPFINIQSILENVAYSAFYAFLYTIGFLLLVLVGVLLTRRHGRLALLLPLGYIIPTVVLGRFDHSTDSAYSLFWVSVSVLAFRILVTLIAPIWIVRSASERAQKRAGAIALPIALGILVFAHAGFLYASVAAYGENLKMMDYYFYFSPELLILAGIALAITLYRAVDPAQPIPGPAHASLETTGY